MEFFNKTGKIALGSRLRLLTAKITEDAAKIYELFGVEVSPKWFPVLFVLSEDGALNVTEIAEQIGHSQPSVTKIVKEMAKAGLVKDNLKSKDKRQNIVALTSKGSQYAQEIIKTQGADVEAAIDGIIAESTNNLWEAIAEWEFLLEQKSLLKRVQEQRKIRESKNVRIVPYEPKYRKAFKALNEEWISAYYEIEEADRKVLNNPEKYILNKGGKILVALYKDEPLGVCALIKMNDTDHDYELSKMAVSPKVQGKNLGWLLGQAIIKTATDLGASKIYLESNTFLKPAINLYYKMGFQKITAKHPLTYKRVNIQMELNLSEV